MKETGGVMPSLPMLYSSQRHSAMCAFGGKADIDWTSSDVRL